MYAIGLDVGIASVGYAVIALGIDERPMGIMRMGARVFESAEHPKSGASLALPRREARSARRRTRRHRHRLERIKKLLISSGLINDYGLGHLFDGQLSDIYELRYRALTERVSDPELCRILIHLAQRRGFKSNRKAETADKETGRLLTAIKQNEAMMKEKGYRTVGEMFCKDPEFKEYKRNKEGNYKTTVSRAQIEDEARMIMESQRGLGNAKITEEFSGKYLEIMLGQRNFDEGPGEPSPYAGNQIENMIGRCAFTGEERAAKACFSFEYFNLLQKINHLYLIKDGSRTELTREQKDKIKSLAFSKSDLRYSHIRKELGINGETLFNTLQKDDYQALEKKTSFNFLPAYHKIKKALDKVMPKALETVSTETLDEIGRIIAVYKGDEKRLEEFGKIGLTKAFAEALLPIEHPKFCHLSLTALRKITPGLENGLTYDKACEEAGYGFKGHSGGEKFKLLPPNAPEMEDLTSPVARRAISQTIKVVNAIIREQGSSPVYVNIELARELAKPYDERKKIEKSNNDNQSNNEKLKNEIKGHFGHEASGQDIVKLKLWKEQDGISPYSQSAIAYDKLFEPNYAEVDHIVPYSVSFDDTYKNKVLVLAGENRDKKNRLPLQYLKEQGQAAAEKFIVWVRNNVRDRRKRANLLKEEISEDDLSGFKQRNLQDTQTISRFLLNYIRDYLAFAPSIRRKNRVTAVNGSITSYLRKRWGIKKIREDGDKHHAVDALIVACTTQDMVSEISEYSKRKELLSRLDPLNGGGFPEPWRGFRKELAARTSDSPAAMLEGLKLPFYAHMDLNAIKPIFVSRMPFRKVSGEAHEATVRSQSLADKGLLIVKKPLTELKLDKKTEEIADFHDPDGDRPLYEALKARLIEFGGDAKKAFADGFRRRNRDGSSGPLVKKVKVAEKNTLCVPLHRNPETENAKSVSVAKNSSMVRVDVFYVESEGYYLVPIYVSDTIKDELPNRAIVAGKPHDEWKAMDEKDFLFSLYPNDLIRITPKKAAIFTKNQANAKSDLPEKMTLDSALVYYNKTGIATASIEVITHDNAYKIASLGVKTLLCLEKYQVDVLGNCSKVSKEVRQDFKRKGR